MKEPKLERYLSASLLLHMGALFLGLFIEADRDWNIQEEVYSVSIETGSKLGGISKVPEKKDFEKPVIEKKQETNEKQLRTDNLNSEQKKELENLLKEPGIGTALTPTVRPTATSTRRPTLTPAPTKTTIPKKSTPTKKPTPLLQPKTKIDSEYSSILREYLGESSRAGGEGIGAGRIGPEKGLGGGILKDPEWLRYRDLIIETIKSNWFWHDRTSKLQAVVAFNLMPDGKIHNIQLKASSGVTAFDSSCLQAVIKTDRLPPPPPRFYEDFRTVEILFVPREMLN
ncbi:MAG: TonB C-terminal domain-containing protein [Deltaproteobacteria bacterium]|nr:TonB C-terminal domain-containing protein [Deltaproteobacteria bacterium]MCX7953409.1 TonB C-terminal domain-containing protein [Deltaproteobacteria bacterium]